MEAVPVDQSDTVAAVPLRYYCCWCLGGGRCRNQPPEGWVWNCKFFKELHRYYGVED